jgi:hypothetical protein
LIRSPTHAPETQLSWIIGVTHRLHAELSADAMSDETFAASLEATMYAVERQPSLTTQQSES